MIGWKKYNLPFSTCYCCVLRATYIVCLKYFSLNCTTIKWGAEECHKNEWVALQNTQPGVHICSHGYGYTLFLCGIQAYKRERKREKGRCEILGLIHI